MELTINHQKRSFEKVFPSLAALLQQEVPGLSQGVAVAVNNVVVPRSEWPDTRLHDADNILIITATQGG